MTGQLTDILVEFGYQGRGLQCHLSLCFFFFCSLTFNTEFFRSIICSIWNARTGLNEFMWTPMRFVGKQAICNLQFTIFFFTEYTFCLQGGNASEKNCNHKPSWSSLRRANSAEIFLLPFRIANAIRKEVKLFRYSPTYWRESIPHGKQM